MNKEEKAKAYDEMTRLLSDWYKSETDIGIKDHISAIYPELKESEDERIRKVIYGWIYTQPSQVFENGFSKEEILAWLEKQGEQKDIINNQSDYVDLGLPSGTLWAKCNLGTEKETDFGLFYQWGDTKGYKGVYQHQFNWDNYKWSNNGNITKYNDEPENNLVLDNEDDPVFVATNGMFKTPTKEQLQELIDHTNYEWATIDGVNGMKFVNKNDDTKYIFMPATGNCTDGGHYDVGSWGTIWSASRHESYANYAWRMDFSVDAVDIDANSRCYGFSVRGVLNK